eukprot:4907220-Amphidinium_carterae.1
MRPALVTSTAQNQSSGLLQSGVQLSCNFGATLWFCGFAQRGSLTTSGGLAAALNAGSFVSSSSVVRTESGGMRKHNVQC